MNIKQEAEFLGKAVTRMDGRADTLTEIIACLEIDLEKLERENFGLRQQNENLKRKEESRYKSDAWVD